MVEQPLNEREHEVLEAVIRTYVETAEPAGSRTIARRFRLGVSPATVRNTMSDLEEKGYLYHPHTSAGRVPTDRAYRLYVDELMSPNHLSGAEQTAIRLELATGVGEGAAIEQLVRRAAQVVGLLTQELGVAVAPRLDEATLERLDLVALGEAKILLVLTLRAAGVRTIYVDMSVAIPPGTLAAVARVLNERLSGLTLSQVRATMPERLRDSLGPATTGAAELLNVFVQSAEEWFAPPDAALHLGRTSVLADQPEFASGERLRALIELTERRDLLKRVVDVRPGAGPLNITIGVEHDDPALAGFTLVTSEYRSGALKGVIGVIGPTRMPYERVVGLVDTTSRLISELLG
jgi:heat-inducible transcriptional repressor